MKNVSDQAAIERILKAIAQDDELIRQFAKVVGVSTQTFSNWIDTATVPEPLPEKVFVTCKQTEDRELNSVAVFYAVHTTMDQAQRQVDKLTMDFPPEKEAEGVPPDTFIIIDAPLNP
jgi:hypothetical protein